jgi:DNA-binding response OmpR family regulator
MSLSESVTSSSFSGRHGDGSHRSGKEFQTASALDTDASVTKLQVLIVDDDPTIRSTLAEAVRAWGYRTLEAATLAETMTLVDQERPSAVLLDVKLPDGSGIEVLAELRRRQPKLVIIMITGYVTHKDAFAAGLRQAYGYVTKPIDQAQVRLLLDEALKGRAASESRNERTSRSGARKRGRPQLQTTAPLGKLIQTAMKLLRLNYKDIVSESERLARLNNNSDMRIGKSTLGNIISGSIRQPGTAKLDSLRMILNLSHAEMDAAIGLQPERRFAEQLESFASKVTSCTWTGSVPPAVAGGSMFTRRYYRGFLNRGFDPPATAGGTDPVQENFPTFEAKPCTM